MSIPVLNRTHMYLAVDTVGGSFTPEITCSDCVKEEIAINGDVYLYRIVKTGNTPVVSVTDETAVSAAGTITYNGASVPFAMMDGDGVTCAFPFIIGAYCTYTPAE